MRFEKLKPSHLDKLEVIAGERTTCQLSAVSLWCYAQKYSTEAYAADGVLFIKQDRPGFGECFFCPATETSEMLAEALAALRTHQSENGNGRLTVWGVTDEILESFNEAAKTIGLRYNVYPDRDWAEYIHSRENLIDMKGKRFHAKKNAVNQFLRQNSDYEYEEITASNIAEVGGFQKRLLAGIRKFATDPASVQSLIDEDAAIRRGLEAFETLRLKGGLIRIDGEIVAYAFGGAINDRIFDLTFEKALRSYNGVYQVLEQEMLKKNLAGYEFINREEDLGNPGLRAAKERLRPDRLLMKHHIVES